MSLRSSLRPKAPTPSAPGLVQIWVGGRSRRSWRWLWLLLAIASLGGALVLLVASFRLGLQLMLDPEAAPRVLAWQRSPQVDLPPAATLEDLRHQAEAANQRLGDPLRLGNVGDTEPGLMIVPVLEASTGAIASLVLFQTDGSDGEWRAIATATIAPLERETVLAPWLNNPQSPTAAPPTFAFTRLVVLPKPPDQTTTDTWLTLEGTWQQQGLTLRYGHLLHVAHQAQQLTLLTPWSSPTNRLPEWADLDGDGPTDLLVDETVGLEPALRGLQAIASTPPRLQSVSWLRLPVDAGGKAGSYQQALRLARAGLWSQAQAHLSELKPALGQAWNPEAEAQLRLMERHAAITRQQADQDWSTPAQHILALVIDGRWEPALARLEAHPDLVPAVLNRLGTDRGRLWNRISAAAALPDPDPAVYVWGGLVLKAQQNQPANRDGATQDWLARQPVPAAAQQRLAKVIAALATAQTQPVARANNASRTQVTAAAEPSSLPVVALPSVEALIGQAQPIAAPVEGYAAPGQSLDASLGQWYAINLRAVRQGLGWQSGSLTLPTGTTPAAAWPAVQPAAQASPQLLHWTGPTTGLPGPLTVRGLTLTQGTPTLLATGPAMREGPLPPLVFSQGALMWLDASQRQQPEVGALGTAIARALFGNQPPPPDFAAALANVPQHSLDLTGDGQPERVLTWDEAALTQLKNWRLQVEPTAPKTIILGQDNRVLYNDLFGPQTVVALTNPAIGGPVGLLVYRAGGYELLAWQALEQRFE
ncbi:hypothetical protein [Nodosilinea sp. E11]|uniref:hypothetical protein n=1 Tax=Nodosilinea sp. E11 TaxID=3037479 RepID=UPI002935204E|nr:hypothetical protein [Nodosilinea sp. E11]WOD39242.1 hypothetical protein RRF56_23835 [Nodosilinea sp. E11]